MGDPRGATERWQHTFTKTKQCTKRREQRAIHETWHQHTLRIIIVGLLRGADPSRHTVPPRQLPSNYEVADSKIHRHQTQTHVKEKEPNRACTPKIMRSQLGTGVQKNEMWKDNITCTKNFRSQLAKVREVVQMRLPPLLVFSSVRPMSKISVSTIWGEFLIPTVWRTSGTAWPRRSPS